METNYILCNRLLVIISLSGYRKKGKSLNCYTCNKSDTNRQDNPASPKPLSIYKQTPLKRRWTDEP